MEPAIYTAKSYVPGRTEVLFSNLSRTIRFSLRQKGSLQIGRSANRTKDEDGS
jgi:hypothetical protein